MTTAELTHLQRFVALIERQIEQDQRWMLDRSWSRKTADRMGEERRQRLAGWEKLPSMRDGVTALLLALHEPRSQRIGR